MIKTAETTPKPIVKIHSIKNNYQTDNSTTDLVGLGIKLKQKAQKLLLEQAVQGKIDNSMTGLVGSEIKHDFFLISLNRI